MNSKIIERTEYLKMLINRKNNGLIKIITGIRRCGKSFLLDPIFKNYLLASGTSEDHIIKLSLDDINNEQYLDAHALNEYILSQIVDNENYYIKGI